ncbi:MAG: hypothetical protein WAN20_07470 [Pseudonocardiaceae bacterium]
MDSKYGAEPGHHPDGLTEQNIDALLRELDTVMAKPRPTSALMDGTDAQRRHRRQARRYGAAVARAWPARAAADDPGGWAA